MEQNVNPVDYLPRYLTDDGFDLPSLLNDDYFLAIKLLFNNSYYVSATKLLISFIDTIGSIEFGDDGSNTFVRWLDTYVDLTPVGITAEELWEHRNSLLHMTNLDSRKVLAGKVKRLSCYVGTLPKGFPSEGQDQKYFNLQTLIHAVAAGMSIWAATFNTHRNKFETFVRRYDLVVSDNRRLEFNYEQ
jgi:hypothetical protein